MSKKTESTYVKNGIYDLYFSNITVGSLIVFDSKDENNHLIVADISPFGGMFSNLLGKKSHNPTLTITAIYNLERLMCALIYDEKKKQMMLKILNKKTYKIKEVLEP